ncbi:MAG: hypothetical protein Ctma_0675 [Catillopecten margaritatus gill symbiont]|uniref:Uncharacterized protein n=1 Tax=Catillopecten margaritatus gill symbiont TaxID=3083288 RepID=A0AAU6PG46_9GAMM
MNTESRAHYLEALGVPDFLYANTKVSTTSSKINTQCLVIETQTPHSFCQVGNTQTFLFKMLTAIGLKEVNIQCVSIQANALTATLEKYNAKTVLLMGAGLNPLLPQHFATHHPSEILKNESFKRETWEVLKKVQACLK